MMRLINIMYENRQKMGGSSLVSEDLQLQMAGMIAELDEMWTRLAVLEWLR